jgi:chromosome segregation ATPase
MESPELFYGIAFVSGCLLTLVFMPLIHKRAVRVTTRHITATAPASVADIRAERDRSRAQFAIAIRQLENNVHELGTKCAGQSADAGRQAAEIHRLETTLERRASQSAEVMRQAAEIHRLKAELKKRTSQSAELARQAPDIRRLEAALAKCASQSAEIARQAAEIHRLEAELKKRAALIGVLRVRNEAQHAVT